MLQISPEVGDLGKVIANVAALVEAESEQEAENVTILYLKMEVFTAVDYRMNRKPAKYRNVKYQVNKDTYRSISKFKIFSKCLR